MNRLRSLTASTILAIAILVVAPVIQTGCITSQRQLAYKTLSVIAETTGTAYSAYADAVIAGKVSLSDQRKVREAKRKYEVSFRAAVVVANGDLGALAPIEVQRLAWALADALRVAMGGR